MFESTLSARGWRSTSRALHSPTSTLWRSWTTAKGIASGGAPSQDDTIAVDFNFARPFEIGGAEFSIEGHIEYIGARTDELGGNVKPWLLAQPQLQWHVSERIAIGIEYQLWINKLGDGSTDESAVQALLVWEF